MRRTTVTEVARRAGVSRMTLYRRFPDVEAVLSALMTREFGRLVARSTEAAADGTARERVVAMVVGGARAVAEDPLFARLVDVDPELLLPYVTRRLGGMQRIAVAAGAEALAVHDGSVRDGRPADVLSAGIELIARGFVLASHGELGLDPWAELGRGDRRVPAGHERLAASPSRRSNGWPLGRRVDVVVVGGGITGAGIALDAASRGLSVALLERRDLAFGTSRWSSKLVHGGLRYLAARRRGPGLGVGGRARRR